jgi:AcrR family transcriptional regulator
MSANDRRARLREDLIEAAERRIADAGLDGLKARDLARDVGCALGAIYNVFPDLDALILAVNGRTLALFEAHLDANLAGTELDGEGERAVDALVALAQAYLTFALENRRRWNALFQHRLTEGAELPDWYRMQQATLFSRVEEPVRRLVPGLDAQSCALLGRSVFSATHGVVSLGLDEKLATLPAEVLRDQLDTVVRAIGNGLKGAR